MDHRRFDEKRFAIFSCLDDGIGFRDPQNQNQRKNCGWIVVLSSNIVGRVPRNSMKRVFVRIIVVCRSNGSLKKMSEKVAKVFRFSKKKEFLAK